MTRTSFPFFLAVWNRSQALSTPRVHWRIARWFDQSWMRGDHYLLLMAFRACGKSTLVGVLCAWLLWRKPDLRILVLSADLALAGKMVRNIKRIIEKHPLTRHLKPESVDQWGRDRFTVVRRTELRDPSVLAKSVSSNLTGTRADVIVCDDVEVPRTSDTPQKREDLREALRELDYILVPGGTQIYIGTPHTWFSIYAKRPRREIGEDQPFLSRFKRLVVPVLTRAGKSIWPERFSKAQIEEMRISCGPAQFSSQMMCRSVNIMSGHLDASALQFYEDELHCQEAGFRPVFSLGGRRLVSASCWWDPSFGGEQNDKSILAVVFTAEDGSYHLHRCLRILADGQENPARAQCVQVAMLVQELGLPSVAVETNGIGKFLPAVLREELARAHIVCTVKEITSRRPKVVRILESFDAVLAARGLYVHASVRGSSFLQEMNEWRPAKGNAQADDALDAVAGALSLEPVRIGRGGKGRGGFGRLLGSQGMLAQATTTFDV